MQLLKQKLQKHSTTRQLVGFEKERPKSSLPEHERQLREDVAWQQTFARALLAYAQAMGAGFSALARAQEALAEAGAHEVVAEAEKLSRGLTRALQRIQQDSESAKLKLETHLAGLNACVVSLAKADEASALLRHYEEKVGTLEEESERKIQPAATLQTKLSRNKEKLQQAAHAADISQTLAQEALDRSAKQRGKLCQLAHGVLACMVDAFRCTTAEQQPARADANLVLSCASRHGAAYTGGGTGAACSSSTPPRATNDAYNPFAEDVADKGDALEDLFSNPFAEDLKAEQHQLEVSRKEALTPAPALPPAESLLLPAVTAAAQARSPESPAGKNPFEEESDTEEDHERGFISKS
eukprot:TRINITY_DN28802_c0_g1_i1.p1 TRINITY_DN28802_c0_g1~~TRINITY_DN28802_c0_g1_i1.p1  ORF type:complete len:355 (-),score=107.86 TRINITY_DN28802_c0_g1_i1:93-1157(-)